MKDKIFQDLEEHIDRCFSLSQPAGRSYAVPALWLGKQSKRPAGKSTLVNPFTYFKESIRRIRKIKPERIPRGKGGGWSKDAVIYNMFVRSTCAFDHNRNGKLDLPLNQEGWRETGTFLKATTLLPYVRSLGANTVHLLPITAIGSDGNKGRLGSPYAIRNPFRIDENLGEPNIGIGAEEEFRIFVHVAHHLGIRVIVEFVFRTSSKDGDWIQEHPEWFYWIRESAADREPGSLDENKYGNPVFSQDELRTIKSLVEEGKLLNLPPPHASYRQLFTDPPPSTRISLEQGRWIGTTGDGTRVRIPGAFADWPPDDLQPPWNDVTYLKMYRHPDYNYIAYNTIRMYDGNLTRPENINTPLWERIIDIIPHYQREFGIDGVMIDMGHALPMELKHTMIARAREIDPEFAFWDENFSVSEQSVREGYNAVIGYQWSDQHHPEKFKQMLRRFGTEGFALPFFATPESHDTPRAAAREGGMTYSRYAWAVSNFLPAIPFIHSGFELGEEWPVNTGLDFSMELQKKYPSGELPLFSEAAYSWLNRDEITAWIRRISGIRRKYGKTICDYAKESFLWVESPCPELIAFIRGRKRRAGRLLILANSDMKNSLRYSLPVETPKRTLKDLLGTRKITSKKGMFHGTLRPGEVNVFPL